MKKSLLFISIALVAVIGSALAAAPPSVPEPLTFTKWIKLLGVKHVVKSGTHTISLTRLQKKTAMGISFPMLSPQVLCEFFEDLAGKTIVIVAVGETDTMYICEQKLGANQ